MDDEKLENNAANPVSEKLEDVSFWKSRFGVILIISLTLAALLLGFEHRIHIFAGNGFLALLLLGCVAMHMFMHGDHSGHGGGDKS
jgi:heme/copper-type cytochrome/quinol oxidase subunit 4